MDLRFSWRGWKTRLRDQRHELKAVYGALRYGGVALDVGANKGSYLYWLARWSRGATVVAFEPQRALAQYLAASCQRLGLSHVRVENLALSDRAGVIDLFVPGGTDSPGASLESSVAEKGECRVERVQVDTLDAYLGSHAWQPVKVIKIDVEGHEMAVLRGAKAVISRDRPLLIIECERRHLTDGATVRDLI
ncbi:MAG: FkbM family methyltransferase, partial [Rhodoferax sp.]